VRMQSSREMADNEANRCWPLAPMALCRVASRRRNVTGDPAARCGGRVCQTAQDARVQIQPRPGLDRLVLTVHREHPRTALHAWGRYRKRMGDGANCSDGSLNSTLFTSKYRNPIFRVASITASYET
jgi:hypothetical protein